jgi:hypothetical protein
MSKKMSSAKKIKLSKRRGGYGVSKEMSYSAKMEIEEETIVKTAYRRKAYQ